MGRFLDHIERDFLGRVTTPRPLAHVALRSSRLGLAALLALLPAATVLASAALGPPELRTAITGTQNVHDTFARFISGVATASSIAVSVAALTLRRDLKGIQSHEERARTNEDYRARMRDRLGARDVPIELGLFLADTLEGVAHRARRAAHAAGASAGEVRSGDLDLATYLASLARRAERAAERCREDPHRLDALLFAALDFEHDLTTRLAHRFARDAPETAHADLAELRELLDDLVLAVNYLKTVDTQTGLSRMSVAILLSTLPSILAASVMVLAYGEGAVAAWGELGAAVLVCGALAVVLFPLACFVSYVLRFLFLNQHTLPTVGFLLGPEAEPLRRE